jgi:hypothetical protein
VNSDDTANAETSATKPLVNETPEKESNLRQILAIALVVFVTDYLRTGFKNWFGLSHPSAFALALFSASTLAWFADRPRKLWGFEPRRPVLTYFLSMAIIALLTYIVFRTFHFELFLR